MKTHLTILTMLASGLTWAGDLNALRESYEREKTRLVKPLDEKLKKDLETLKVSLVKESKLEEAAKVDAVLKERFPQPGIASPKEPYKFGPSVWEIKGRRIQFREDGLVSNADWDKRGTWRPLDDRKVEITMPNGKKAWFELSESGETAKWKQHNSLDKVAYPVRR
ncbi:hypothetical protein OVA24_17500 [Luteolibacter sp. SL250]|uniref:hypothetical protein n=1 Tax=Luteolibacter sp. SL250 TaxID=2995170 RepID=UPI0022721835|nr:hypothetical protein [Luteolibacter sp. SL250]WAC19028.1 hypothetical protein OVA24_17500 [Luteolibacter sp. SL250]